MAGPQARCFFCADSRGTDIEHFWPKSVYPQRMFLWMNLLLSCSTCNTRKGIQFPLDGVGHPLLVDPTLDDPWDYLFFDSLTGNITAKYDPQTQSYNPKGLATTDSKMLSLNDEPVVVRRQAIYERLTRYIGQVLSGIAPLRQAGIASLEVEADRDEYGLMRWFFRKDGQLALPFSNFLQSLPHEWAQVMTHVRA